MATDVRDILDADKKDEIILPTLTNKDSVKPKPKPKPGFKKPPGMSRELYSLLWTDNDDQATMIPVLPDYQTAKAVLSNKKVKPWEWQAFTSPARSDGLVLHHWRRLEGHRCNDFSKFNKKLDTLDYTEEEYEKLFKNETNWSKEETDHLFELVKRFDRKWFVINDRFDHKMNPDKIHRSVEDLKERYYQVCDIITSDRAGQQDKKKSFFFDANHEKKRKIQLEKFYAKSKQDHNDELLLIQELKRLKYQKKSGIQKITDIKKLLAFENNSRHKQNGDSNKKNSTQSHKRDTNREKASCFKFSDVKYNGNISRRTMFAMPPAVPCKKAKFIDKKLMELGIDPMLIMPTENILELYNNLRDDILLQQEQEISLSKYEAVLNTLTSKMKSIPLMEMTPTQPENRPYNSEISDSPLAKKAKIRHEP